MLTYRPEPGSYLLQTVFRVMVLCILAMTATAMVNVWVHASRKRSAHSTRWLAKGLVWTLVLAGIAVIWIRALFVAFHEHFSEYRAFAGWFGYALILLGMMAFNLLLAWRRIRSRKRRRSRRQLRSGV